MSITGWAENNSKCQVALQLHNESMKCSQPRIPIGEL